MCISKQNPLEKTHEEIAVNSVNDGKVPKRDISTG